MIKVNGMTNLLRTYNPKEVEEKEALSLKVSVTTHHLKCFVKEPKSVLSNKARFV